MRIGVGLSTSGGVGKVVERAKAAAEAGAKSLWISQLFGHDALTIAALVGESVPGVELGTAVVPIYSRHPMMLAAQALTVQSATDGRLTLGIGLSHEFIVEGIWGLSYSQPARYMREYLSILNPLLEGEQVNFKGQVLRTATLGPLDHAVDDRPPLLLGALGRAMLQIAGEMTDGACTWLVGPKTLARHTVPTLSKAARVAGRPAPRLVAGLPVCVANDPDAAHSRAAREFAIYGQLPAYRAMLDREGVESPADLAIVGDEEAVAASIARVGDAGATDLWAGIFGTAEEQERTSALVGELARSSS